MYQTSIPIKRIQICGLHSERDITLDFDSNIKILVDDNGSGKTTFLNIVVGILQGTVSSLNKIRRYDFESIEIEFSDSKTVKFTEADFSLQGFDSNDSSFLASLFDNVPAQMVEELMLRVSRHSTTRRAAQEPITRNVAILIDSDPYELVSAIRRHPQYKLIRNKISDQKSFFEFADELIKKKLDLIRELFPFQVLYFPTYRLVEENLHYLGYEKQEMLFHSKQLIQFGMEDVRKRWNKITQDIRNKSVDGFARINGQMLDELAEEINPDLIHYNKIADDEALALVLSRSGDSVSAESRAKILELVRSQEILSKKFEPLAYFLSNLISIHEAQKDKDDAINDFVKVINEYLSDKAVVYDASELSLQVRRKSDGEIITLDKLSSGEKQIISIFTKLFLEFDNSKPFAVIFDEPELSLSSEWQEKLLHDIANSNKTAFLLAATHSPFIYEDNLLDHTDVLSVTMRSGEAE